MRKPIVLFSALIAGVVFFAVFSQLSGWEAEAAPVNIHESSFTPWKVSVITADGTITEIKAAGCRKGRVLVPVRSFAEALEAQVNWHSAASAATITMGSDILKLVSGSNELTIKGETIHMGVPAEIANSSLVAPVRFISDALGADLSYSLVNKSVRVISALPEKPERVSAASFPARVALTNNGHLWLLDGSQASAAPVQVTHEGYVEILGWSADGQWLMYLYRESPGAKPYLWVVQADGAGAFQIDPQPVRDMLNGNSAVWSPEANIIAYSTMEFIGDHVIKIAVLDDGDGKATLFELLTDKNEVADFAWAPDGKSIVYSLPRTGEHALIINCINLKGEVSNLLTEGEACSGPDSVLSACSATGFRWSPDGRYLAYYLNPGSASLAADGVAIRVLDLQRSCRPLELGTGLKYAQWLDWSLDSSLLAYISGYGRDATVDKHLFIADVQSGKITDCGSAGQADTQPVWSEQGSLLFCRGLENAYWDDFKGAVLVPGQRIWQWTNAGETKSLTNGSARTADYAPMISPDGKNLLYLRLNRYDNGALYLKPLAGGQETEVLRGVTGAPGYYGNYYPAWVSIYSLEEAQAIKESMDN